MAELDLSTKEEIEVVIEGLKLFNQVHMLSYEENKRCLSKHMRERLTKELENY